MSQSKRPESPFALGARNNRVLGRALAFWGCEPPDSTDRAVENQTAAAHDLSGTFQINWQRSAGLAAA